MAPPVGISVVIPLYNKARTVARAMESVLAQRGAEFEVVVVDDGSTDGSDKIAAAYGSRIVYLRQDNAGPAAARNRGVERSKHPIVAFLDADDELLPECLAAHLEVRRRWPDIELSLASFRTLMDGTTVGESGLLARAPGLEGGNGLFRTNRFWADLVMGVHVTGACIDKNLFNEIGGFDPELRCWEVTEFLLRAELAAPWIGILADIHALVHQEPGNSHFQRTRGNPDYLCRFADKILDRMETIPDGERRRFLKQVVAAMYALWSAGRIEEFKFLSRRAYPYLGRAREAASMYALAALPDFALRSLLLLRNWSRVFIPALRSARDD